MRERTPGLSRHLELEIAAACWRGRGTGRPVPLAPGEPVPGCACASCAPARAPHERSRGRRWAAGAGTGAEVERARTVSILDVARILGLDPKPVGREYVARCPLHEDAHPSLRLNPDKGTWYCFPCGAGGDGIELVRSARDIGFREACKFIVGGAP